MSTETNSGGSGAAHPFIAMPPPGVAPDPRNADPEVPESEPTPDFISLPPGLPLPTNVADSATHRLAEMRRQTDTSAATRVPPVVRAPPNSIMFTPAPTVGAPLPTRPSAALVWTLRFGDTTQPLARGSAVCVGRNPVATSTRPDALLRAVVDPAKSVSKTHAMLWADEVELYVQDLDSTNGVSVVDADGTETQLASGATAVIAAGSSVYLGDFPIVATRD